MIYNFYNKIIKILQQLIFFQEENKIYMTIF